MWGKRTCARKFSGDGEREKFILSEKLVRPLVKVENVSGSRFIEADDTVDYGRGAVIFRIPPKKGEAARGASV